MLTFTSDDQRQQAERLMQPALIRVVDNLRKRLEASNWREEYKEYLLWPPTATDAQKQRVIQLRQQMDTADPSQLDAIQTELAQLPIPYPGYELHLHQAGRPSQTVDVWQICCQVCFTNYDSTQPVRVDASLLEADGEVDWLQLDTKARQLIDTVFPDPETAATAPP